MIDWEENKSLHAGPSITTSLLLHLSYQRLRISSIMMSSSGVALLCLSSPRITERPSLSQIPNLVRFWEQVTTSAESVCL